MNRQKILEYYSRKDVADFLVKSSKNREIAGAFWDGSYDKRPNILQFPTDVFQMAKNGVTSFHLSVERWSNPMALRQDNYEKLRTGWDLIIDIDSKISLEESKITAMLICKLFRKHGIKNYGIKFSGRRGFHLCLPWESFPKEVDYKPLQKLYPDAPRILTAYIRKKIAKKLMSELVKSKGAIELINSLAEPPSKLNPFYFVEVEKNWGVRHMFRAPYSFNEKTWLVSLPISSKDIMTFSESAARPEKIETETEFFVSEENSAESLFLAAMDWHAMRKKEKKKETEKPRIQWEKKIGEELFPPCIKLVLSGMQDGRKRSLFVLINFLKTMNWKWEEIEDKVFQSNEKNKPPLPRNYVIAQLRYQQQYAAKPPANCDVAMYYKDIGICQPDIVCKGRTERITIKNPVNYPFRTMGLRKKERVKLQGFSCLVCKKQFSTAHGLELHKGRMH